MFSMLEGCGRYVDRLFGSTHFSDRFTYVNYFNPNYGLKDMIFQSFIDFLEFLDLFKLTLSEIVSIDVSISSAVNGSADQSNQTSGSHWSVTVLINRV